MFAGVNNSWCSEEEETSSPPEDGLTDGFSRIVERPWQMKRKLSSHSLTFSVQLTFGAFIRDSPGITCWSSDCSLSDDAVVYGICCIKRRCRKQAMIRCRPILSSFSLEQSKR